MGVRIVNVHRGTKDRATLDSWKSSICTLMEFSRASLASRSCALLWPDMAENVGVWATHGMDLRSHGEGCLFIGCSSSLELFCRAKNISRALNSSRFLASSHESDSGT
jgi:hypothetical protein